MCFRSYDVNGSLLGSESADWVPSSFFLKLGTAQSSMKIENASCAYLYLYNNQQHNAQRSGEGGRGTISRRKKSLSESEREGEKLPKVGSREQGWNNARAVSMVHGKKWP